MVGDSGDLSGAAGKVISLCDIYHIQEKNHDISSPCGGYIMKEHTLQRTRTAVQLAALALFVVLLRQGRITGWFLLFFITGIIGSFFLGRVYCGWLCPMGTLLRAQTWGYRKLRLNRVKGRALPVLRWVVLAGAAAVMLVSRRSGQQIPLMPVMILVSLTISLFVHESFWHRNLCPFGALLTRTTGKFGKSVVITESSCIGCGKCERVCPSCSIGIQEEKIRYNSSRECLVCRACIPTCPTGAIAYEGRSRNNHEEDSAVLPRR